MRQKVYNWLPFEEARNIIIGQKIKSKFEWVKYCKKDKPFNIPSNPDQVYKKEFLGYPDWLGNNNVAGGQKIYTYNHDFFKIWSHDMAYILGFWFADGNIHKNNFKIDQHKDDAYLLNNILSVMDYNGAINISGNMARLSIYDKNIIDDIKKLGGTEKKSLTCEMPFVPLKYFPDFVRGNFDGDGCIYYNKIDSCYLSGFCSGSKNFIQSLFVLLQKNIPNLHGRIETRKGNGKYLKSLLYLINFGRNDTIRLKDFMYNTPSRLFLKRKHDLFVKTGNIKIARGAMLCYDEAKKYVHTLCIKSKSKWYDFWKDNDRPLGIPLGPDTSYKNKGWISWGKWLGKDEEIVNINKELNIWAVMA